MRCYSGIDIFNKKIFAETHFCNMKSSTFNFIATMCACAYIEVSALQPSGAGVPKLDAGYELQCLEHTWPKNGQVNAFQLETLFQLKLFQREGKLTLDESKDLAALMKTPFTETATEYGSRCCSQRAYAETVEGC